MGQSAVILNRVPDAAEALGGAARVGDYLALLKPRVMSLVVFTGLVGLAIAPGSLHPVLAAVALLAIALGAGAAGALNMWYDADIDAGMARTRGRPLPRGLIAREEALAFGTALSLIAVMIMGLAVNFLAAGLLALTIGFYVGVYTIWLKRRTAQNIVIGGAAGALPPLIGWTAATGGLAVEPLILFLIIFLWTPPHFWALALYREGDYARVGVPMMPVVAGVTETCRQIGLYALLLVAASALPVLQGFAGGLYAVTALGLGGLFLWFAAGLWRARDDAERRERRALRLFAFSIGYLALLFASLLVERALGFGGLS